MSMAVPRARSQTTMSSIKMKLMAVVLGRAVQGT
jgi:hypothetical protein